MREKSVNARAWMTLNRKCNLRCDWCYAKSTNYDNFADMTIDKAYHIIDMLCKLNIHHISLIGGEPTLYCDLINVIEYAKKHNVSCGIITNGIKLANQDFLSELKNAGLHNVNLSLKGYSRENFKDSTGFDRYQQSLDAIKNLKNSNIPFSVSMVINPNNSKYFLSGVSDAIKKGQQIFIYPLNLIFQY